MANLRIRVFKHGSERPSNTITIPGGVLKIASNLVPRRARLAMQDEGIDLDEIVRLSETHEAQGTIVEIEDHDKDERVVVSFD